MCKHILAGLFIFGAGYSIAGLAGVPPMPVPSPPTYNSSTFGTDNFTLNSTVGSNANAAGRGPESLANSLQKIFFGGPDLHFNPDGLLVDSDNKLFSGTTSTGEIYKDGKKQ